MSEEKNSLVCTCDCHEFETDNLDMYPERTHVFNEENSIVITMDFVNKQIHLLVYCWHCQRYFLIRWYNGYVFHMFELKILKNIKKPKETKEN